MSEERNLETPARLLYVTFHWAGRVPAVLRPQ
jgi:hypothetical protein